jgi:hypothetical protein
MVKAASIGAAFLLKRNQPASTIEKQKQPA